MDNPAATIPSTPTQSAVSSLPVEALAKAGPAESSNHRWFLWLIGGAALLGFGIAISLFSAKFLNQSPSPSQLTSTPTSTQSPTPTPTTDLPANWKTYTNQELSFSFKYRTDMLLKEDTKDRVLVFWKGQHTQNFSGGLTIKENPGSLDPRQYAKTNLCQGAFVREFCLDLVNNNIKETKLSNIGGINTKYNLYESEDLVYVFTNPPKSRIFIFTFGGETGTGVDELDSATVDQILSTFHFLK